LYSARSAADYDDILFELDGLHQIPAGDDAFERALEVQRTLAHIGGLHHRSVKVADLVIAASAEIAGATMWHYDEDFDRIAAITGQPCQWVAPRGSL
ncbi:MAG: PIN domain-containing protein, partial [Actinomycetota bacterium]|nr:PIN domain-containing protein [Actinomycetota bacterium]